MIRAFKSTPATAVKVGDTIIFDCPMRGRLIERTSIAECDGWIGLHASNGDWRIFLAPTDTIRVLTPTAESAA